MRVKKVRRCPEPGCGGTAWWWEDGTRLAEQYAGEHGPPRITLVCEKCSKPFEASRDG